jgi:hypothetical protein
LGTASGIDASRGLGPGVAPCALSRIPARAQAAGQTSFQRMMARARKSVDAAQEKTGALWSAGFVLGYQSGFAPLWRISGW